MRYHSLIPLIAAIASLVLGIIVHRSGPRTMQRRVFTFLAGALVFWNLNFFVLYSVSDHDAALFLTRILRVGSLLLPPAILHLNFVLQDRRPRSWRIILTADYAVAGGLIVANAFDLFVSDLRQYSWGYYSVGTPLYNVYTLLVLANFLAAIAVLVHDYRSTTEPRMRQQLNFWLLGVAIALPLGLTNLLPAYGIPFYPLGNLGNVAWAGVVAYAIVRHRLMDIDLVITKGMAYAAVSFALVGPAFGISLWLQRLSFGQIHPDFSVAVLVMLITVGVFFPTLRLRAQERIAQSLFREKHEYRAALTAFTRKVIRILDREKLLDELATTLSRTLQVDRVAIALTSSAKEVFTVCCEVGTPAATTEFPKTHEIINALVRRQQAVLRDELESSEDVGERTEAAGACRENGWEAFIPLAAGGNLIGFIGLGRKRNLDAFYAEDLELLETLGAEAAVALENARLYEELKKSQDIIRRADRLSALGTLAAGIAHEVRNPLVSIQTFFQLAPERLHDEEFLTTFLSMTANEVKRISDLITELLSFARSPTRTLSPINLNEAVERVATLLEPEARKHKLMLTRLLSPVLPLVQADADQVKQVLINLVLNAIQATPAEGEIVVSSRVVRHRDVEFGQVEIRDTGVGIPQGQLDHIFNPFFTTKDKGTGLGLAIANQIVTEHGGYISVESTEGKGTSFFVDLPAAAASVSSDKLPSADDVTTRYERPRKIAS